MLNSKTTLLGILLFVVAVSEADAESPGATKTVKVTVAGPLECREKISPNINVVVDGNETTPVGADRQKNTNTWIGFLDDKAEPIKTEGARASLRLGGLRTNCETSARDPHSAAGIASFTFQCDPRAARTLQVQVDPLENPIGYERRAETGCTDRAFFPKGGPKIVEDIWTSERLSLHLGPKNSPAAIELSILSPSSSEALLTFSKPFEAHATRGTDTRKLEKPERIILVLEHQRARGDKTVPHLSGPAIDIDTKLLEKAGVQSLVITVTK